MLQVSRVAKSFGGRTLFRDVTWTVNNGDRVGLVGPNGAGKTTLLRIIAGDESRDNGAITLGKDVTFGYIPQEVARTACGTVLEHVLGGRPDIMHARAKLRELEKQTATADTVHAQVELIEELTHLGSHQLEPDAHKIVKGLGFAPEQLTTSMAQLSGGWAMRAELAKLLLAAPKVLLLDEPTNHLDLASLDWLEAFLADYDGAWVVVSHDRYFLNRRVTSIAELTPEGILVFDGTYDDYVEGRAELDEQLEAKAVQREKRMDEMRAFVERFRAKASKARQAQSKAKALEKLSAEASTAQRAKKPRRALKLALPEPVRSGDIVATARDIAKAYGDTVVYDGVNLTVRRGDRIALVGENGAGKSTLLKLLAGALKPDRGTCELGHNVATYYFAQHQMDALRPGHTVYDEMRAIMPTASESQVRGILGAFLFSGDDVDKHIEVLSGGEKSRLVLAMMLARPANFLLLDEPTNHLDLTSRGVLENVLATFPGTIVFISHDRYFIDSVATKLVEVRPGPTPTGRGSVLTEFPGDYDYYLWKRVAVGPPSPGVAEGAAVPELAPGRVTREERKAQAREANKKAKEVARLEGEIASAEARVKEIDASLCDPIVYADAAKSRALLDERRALDERLPELYAAWESAAG